MKKNIFIIFLLCIVFFLGIEVGVRKTFPYPQLKSIKFFLIGNNRVNSTLYYYKKLLYESFSSYNDKTIVMLGDSITSFADWDELADRNDILNRGISGDNTDGLLGKLDNLPENLTKAFIMIGINDLKKGSSVKYIFSNYKKIINILQEKNIIPIIQSTLYVEKKDAEINLKVQKLNQLLFTYANDNNITYINLNSQLSSDDALLKQYSLDGLHLNLLGYKVWIKYIKSYL